MAYQEDTKPEYPRNQIDEALIQVLTSQKFQDTFLSTKAITQTAGIEERILYYDNISNEYVVLRKRTGEKFRKEIYRGISFYDSFNRWQVHRQLAIGEYDPSTIQIARQLRETVSHVELRRSDGTAERIQTKKEEGGSPASTLADPGKAQDGGQAGTPAGTRDQTASQSGPGIE